MVPAVVDVTTILFPLTTLFPLTILFLMLFLFPLRALPEQVATSTLLPILFQLHVLRGAPSPSQHAGNGAHVRALRDSSCPFPSAFARWHDVRLTSVVLAVLSFRFLSVLGGTKREERSEHEVRSC